MVPLAQPIDRRSPIPVNHLTPGDVVIVTRIDRLARSTFDLFAIVKQIGMRVVSSAHWLSHGPTPPPVRGG